MSSKSNHFKLGVFVIFSVLLVVAGLVAFGARSYFEPVVVFETYVDDSVEGLNVGSPVKFRGVEIGSVTEIDFTMNVYDFEAMKEDSAIRNYILVRFKIRKKMLPGIFRGDYRKTLDAAVAKGLRARVASKGITGISVMQLDVLDPESNPVVEYAWEPDYYVIPSTKGQFSKMMASIEQILKNLEKLKVDKLGVQAAELLAELRKTNKNLDELVANFNERELNSVLNNLRMILENVNSITYETKRYPSKLFFADPPPPAKSVRTEEGIKR